MRTTLTLEKDVAEKLKRRMIETKRTLKDTVNEALRIGLGQERDRTRPPRFRVDPIPGSFLPGIDHDRMNQLADQLEAEAIARKLPR
jgi:hypothetical protein